MNKNEYGEIINGQDTYKEIAAKLKNGESVIIGWTDEKLTRFDILLTYLPYTEGTYLQRGIRVTDIFVSIIGIGSYGFDISNDKEPGYVGEKLKLGNNETTEKLTELLNGIIGELRK